MLSAEKARGERISVEHQGVNVGAVHGGVTTGGPAGAAANEVSVIYFSNEELAGLIRGALHLHMAFEAEIVVSFGKELAIHGAVRVVASGAAFAHCLMLVNKWA